MTEDDRDSNRPDPSEDTLLATILDDVNRDDTPGNIHAAEIYITPNWVVEVGLRKTYCSLIPRERIHRLKALSEHASDIHFVDSIGDVDLPTNIDETETADETDCEE